MPETRRSRALLIALGAILAALGAPLVPAQPVVGSDPCQAFTVVAGDPADVAEIKAILQRLQDGYRGSSRSPLRFLREFDPSRFVSGYTELERDLERDFEVLRNRELLCRRGTLNVQGDLAVLQADWEKFGFVGPGLDRVEQRGSQSLQLMRVPGRGPAGEWKITGLAGERIFGSTRSGDFVDLAVTGLSVPSTIPFGGRVTLRAAIQNLGAQATAAAAVVRFFDTTAGRSVQIGSDQTVPRGLDPGGSASVSVVASGFTTVGPRTFLAVVDPGNLIRELNEANNRLTASATVRGADATPVVTPNPHTVAFPTSGLTIRVTDPDQAGKKTVRVRVSHLYASGGGAGPKAPSFATDEEELVLTEAKTPGIFERTSVSTGSFFCVVAPTNLTKGNGALEFPRNQNPANGCFNFPFSTASGTLTARYVEPVDSSGRVNVERKVKHRH